jgi:hypothetical protein
MVISDKERMRHWIFFAFQLRKNNTEAIGMICLGEGAVMTCKNWYERFREEDFNLP